MKQKIDWYSMKGSIYFHLFIASDQDFSRRYAVVTRKLFVQLWKYNHQPYADSLSEWPNRLLLAFMSMDLYAKV